MLFIFFFSSRRRHTSWPRDWSSDVCSSDLAIFDLCKASTPYQGQKSLDIGVNFNVILRSWTNFIQYKKLRKYLEIGRASCRERVKIRERKVAEKKKRR